MYPFHVSLDMKRLTLFIVKYLIWKLLLILLLLIGFKAFGQQRADQTEPNAYVWMEDHNFIFETGSVHDIEILVVRFEGGKKTKFSGLKTMGPKDIRIDISKTNRKGDAYLMKVKIPAQAESKKHYVVLMGDGPNANKIKGTTFSIQVVKSEARVKN